MTENRKSILVTGADGFIGSHLTEELLRQSYKVRALTLYNSFNHHGWLEGIKHPDLEIVTGDIRDPYLCRTLVGGVSHIFNLAALIAIPFSYSAPNLYIETNVKGTLNLCQAAVDQNITKFIQVSTSEVYGTAQYIPIDEKHPKQPQSPYSASKIGADAIALSFYYSFNLPVLVARPFNTYGPRQSARAVIPTIISQLLKGDESIKLGDTSPTRDFCYVGDTCKALIALANSTSVGSEVNIATGNEISIKDLASLICEIVGKKENIKISSDRIRPQNSEVKRLCGDASLLKQLTGYKPAITLRDGLAETIKWFSSAENLKQYKHDVYNI